MQSTADSPQPSAAPAPTHLQALRTDPSGATFTAFALDVLGMEASVTLADLTAADFDQVISEAVDSEEEWAVLYKALPAIVKAQLRAKSQHPRGRADRDALPNRPTAEQLKAQLGEGPS